MARQGGNLRASRWIGKNTDMTPPIKVLQVYHLLHPTLSPITSGDGFCSGQSLLKSPVGPEGA